MFKEKIDQQAERERGMISAPPANEELTDPKGTSTWLERVESDPDFERQTEERRVLINRLERVFSSIPRPDTSIQDAIREGLISEESAAEIYESVNKLLGKDSDYRRIALYLPFEFFPLSTWRPKTSELREQTDAFKSAFMETWHRLLYIQDVRANFVDGDVLEVDRRTSDLEYVVKAAHLIPKLMESGMITADEVFSIAKQIEDPTLRESIEAALTVADDLHLLNTADLNRMDEAGLHIDRYRAESTGQEVLGVRAVDVAPESIEKRLATSMKIIENQSFGDVAVNRAKWLRKKEYQRAIEHESDLIRDGIDQDLVPPELLEDISRLSIATQQAMVEGIRKAIELNSYDSQTRGLELLGTYQKTLFILWREGDASLRPSLIKTFCHLHALQIMNDEQLSSLGITIPALAGPYSKNLEQQADQFKPLQRVAGSIRDHAEVSRFVYPAVVAYGSKVKGYGYESADIDASLFIRPDTHPEQREYLVSQIAQICRAEQVDPEELTEFWTKRSDQGLEIRNDIEKPTVAEPTWTHVLFNGAWEGDPETINEIKRDVLIPYFFEQDERTRRACLEEIERDALQYRLMHRGYEQYYPAFGGISTPRSNAIDGQSAFYDSGYRRTATMLFARNVFLPKLKNKE